MKIFCTPCQRGMALPPNVGDAVVSAYSLTMTEFSSLYALLMATTTLPECDRKLLAQTGTGGIHTDSRRLAWSNKSSRRGCNRPVCRLELDSKLRWTKNALAIAGSVLALAQHGIAVLSPHVC